MSTVSVPSSVPPANWQWPAAVLEFAARNQVTAYLDPLLEATRRLFPTARLIEVTVYHDHELRDVSWITFHVCVPRTDIPDFVKARHSWTPELYRICPKPLVCNFVLDLQGVDA